MSSRLLSLLLIPATSLVLLANGAVRESYSLALKVEAGQKLSLTTEASGTFELADAEITIGPDTLPESPMADFEFSASRSADVEILTAADGKATSMKLKVTGDDNSLTGEVSAMGQSQRMDESTPSKVLGHTVLIETDEDGEVSATDVSEDDSLEPLSSDDLDNFDLDNPFSILLPEDPVDVGESWDIIAAIKRSFEEDMESEASDEDMEEIEKVLNMLGESSTIEFTGTLQSVEGQTANIEWSASGTVDELDLLHFAREMGAGGELDELPLDGFELAASMTLELAGKGQFNLATHQLTSINLEGEYTVTFTGAASAQGTDVALSAEFEGVLEFSGGCSVE